MVAYSWGWGWWQLCREDEDRGIGTGMGVTVEAQVNGYSGMMWCRNDGNVNGNILGILVAVAV